MGGFARRWWVVLGVALAVGAPAQAGWLDRLKGALGKAAPGQAGEAPAGLSTEEITAGLREALIEAARRAAQRASAPGGFLDDPRIHVPLPERLEKAAALARRFGLGGQADAFEETLNRAAERAAAEAFPVLAEAVRGLTFEDVQAVWQGGETAATDYLRRTTRDALYARFLPVVRQAASEVGVTRAYQRLAGRPEIASYVAGSDLDLDHYVTEKALDGLFTLVAEEERRIRTDPVARSTDLLRRVFGAL
ncbi:DUF4197 domain-containing protein [Inmirania thermothiophila]|uniref:Uncharacterized protein DUF4197 n=1 Tax=Inmirania thermothiophila TaxID=1750597 RepID=A0A3N1YBP0_9GAMM|nr:DUF4197 domain-containing protein [Inmirania thermothiophila]ROR35082.1 uncharacterized protein DUF4197 [Inmirania thermothiophila]